jgi:hypothetical protein
MVEETVKIKQKSQGSKIDPFRFSGLYNFMKFNQVNQV